MARGERQEDATRGGVGTVTRLGRRARQDRAEEAGQAAQDPRHGRQARPVPPQRPVTDQEAVKARRSDAGQVTAGRRGPRPGHQLAAGQRPAGEQRPVTDQRGGAAQRAGGGRYDAPQGVTAPARSRTRPSVGAPWRVPPARRATGPQPAVPPAPQPQPGQAGLAQAGQAQAGQGAQAGRQSPPRARADAAAAAGSRRMPFVVLLCGLLGGALVSALVISTTLAEGSFRITSLQSSTSTLARQRQALEEQVAQAQSAQVIEQRASQLGMRRSGELRFVDLTTGKTSSDGPTWSGAVNAPGYVP